jgi:hypothetical protein
MIRQREREKQSKKSQNLEMVIAAIGDVEEV